MANSTQEGILDAAEEVFASHGYEGATMRAIAKKADVNQALLHYHFQTKDNLYETVVKRRSTAINRYRLELLDQLLVFAGPGLREASLQLRRRQVVDGLDAHQRRFPAVAANRRSQPLEPLLVGGVARQQVP